MASGNRNMGVVWLDGKITDYASAQVSLEDRGFLFGDGVYESIRVYNCCPFALPAHLTRLERSATGIEALLPKPLDELARLVHELVEKAAIPEAEVYIQVTRGAARRSHLFPVGADPTLVIGVQPARVVPHVLYETGCTAITLEDERWARCDLKTVSLLPNVLAKEKAHRAGAFEAILQRNGLLTEGTSSNVFAWRDGRIITAISDNRILPGVTRAITIKLARDLGYQVVECDIRTADLLASSEIFLTSTSIELMPVVVIDDGRIGEGRPGEVWRDLHGHYRALVAAETGGAEDCNAP
ncbi:MAG TPA: D-amino acid aminotransferase [Blastocatellia bacterium]|nr:D-amino acid aminotransferase [Blastocatellia bacterium]